MLICIPQLLSKAQVASVRGLIDAADWVDGRETAGAQSARAKKNTQLPAASPEGLKAQAIINAELGNNPLFLAAALPLKVFPPLFNRYGVGDRFGAHVDNAIRSGPTTRIRTDLSATLFLTEPDDYDGGELVIETQFGAQDVKLEAGDMVLYPASSLHRVTEITRGARVSSFFWLQSMIRDDGERALLFDLDQSIQTLAAERSHDDAEVIRLTGIYHNLIRRWADA